MSTKLTSYVWDGCASSGMKLSSVAIMARLADFSSDEGVCWPSIATIARQIGAGESTVRTAISALEKEGWLTRKSRRQGNRNASNVYTLNVQKLRAAAFAHLSDSDTSNPDASKSDASKSDASESDPSKFEASEFSKKGGFDPSESGGDPSVNTTTDPSDKKPLCQVAAQPDSAVVITDLAKQVLSHLNQQTGSRYQVSKTSMEHIRARLGEGFSADDLKLVVDYATAKWFQDLQMAEYLRPTTLFLPTKFPGYLQGATKWAQAGRPERVNGRWVAATGPSASFQSVDYSLPENAGFRS
ncbi:conserved phage C-terminal domain-containing protein [Phytobacter diazotrophicus]|uniref:conserved phage C-terminal domain-containing protein n=1 Tax=Phytobacter diazotrophicus TaxID=395631 RepID=UPI0013EC0D87|nr:conserved phage C-terminal domain-containing protein [Phytobacter diazotrophicus]MDU7131723.1 conserved phage C-terminal domain-containing protein [Enterobacteriaceae bacterium]QIH63408.1 GntR family transcriptional regulator [Enterobacteriaceae bacterium A-F18]